MRILFTSDLHGLTVAYERYAEVLASGEYDAGIIGGDLMTHLTPREMRGLLTEHRVTHDDLLEELDSPKTEPAALTPADNIYSDGIQRRAEQFREILHQTGLPVYFLMGNDDGIVGGGIEWPSERLVRSVNQRRVEAGPYNIVGDHYPNPLVGGRYEKTEKRQSKDLAKLRCLVNSRTILVTHGPPYGTLDRTGGESVGSRPLAQFVARAQPWLHLFGHIHESFGVDGNAVNGSFPQTRQFVDINVESRQNTYTEAVPGGVNDQRHPAPETTCIAPESQSKKRVCRTCQYYSAGFCHKWSGRPAPEDTYQCWEQRREVSGWTIWEVLDREG